MYVPIPDLWTVSLDDVFGARHPRAALMVGNQYGCGAVAVKGPQIRERVSGKLQVLHTPT